MVNLILLQVMYSVADFVRESEDRLYSLIHKEDGQGSIEYLLTLGAVVTVIVAAIAAAVALDPFDAVVTQACDEVIQVMDSGASC